MFILLYILQFFLEIEAPMYVWLLSEGLCRRTDAKDNNDWVANMSCMHSDRFYIIEFLQKYLVINQDKGSTCKFILIRMATMYFIF